MIQQDTFGTFSPIFIPFFFYKSCFAARPVSISFGCTNDMVVCLNAFLPFSTLIAVKLSNHSKFWIWC